MQVAEPTLQERTAIEREVGQPGPIEAALAAAGSVLSDLSACAGVVMVPRREPLLAQLQLVPLSSGQALAVLVGADGGIENRVFALPPGLPPGALEGVRLCTPPAQRPMVREAITAGRAALANAEPTNSYDLAKRADNGGQP